MDASGTVPRTAAPIAKAAATAPTGPHPCAHLLCQTGRSGGMHKRPRKALHVSVGPKQTDRVVQFLLKRQWSRFSVHAAPQQCVVMKRGHGPPLIGAKSALVGVGTRRDGAFQRIVGFL